MRSQSSEEHEDIVTDLHAAQEHLDFLESGYLSSIDALRPSLLASLESAPPPTQASALPSAAAVSTAAGSTSAAPAPAPKKTRARRVPKGVVPGVTPAPDPERWIKKSERSTFSTRRRGNKAGGATQGIVLEQRPGQLVAPPMAASTSKGGKGKKKR
jgi:signal recognition particle subunit SRP72